MNFKVLISSVKSPAYRVQHLESSAQIQAFRVLVQSPASRDHCPEFRNFGMHSSLCLINYNVTIKSIAKRNNTIEKLKNTITENLTHLHSWVQFTINANNQLLSSLLLSFSDIKICFFYLLVIKIYNNSASAKCDSCPKYL